MTAPIQNYGTTTLQSCPGPSAKPTAASVSAQSQPQDTLQVSNPLDDVIVNLRVRMPGQYFQPDAQGKLPIQSLDAALVPHQQIGDPGITAMKVLELNPESQPPEGYVNVPTVIPVKQELLVDGKIPGYTSDIIPDDGLVLTSKELDDKLEGAYKHALPTGKSAQIAETRTSQMTKLSAGLVAQMVGQTGGYYAASSLAGIIHAVSASASGPLALGASAAMLLGPNTGLQQLGTLDKQKAYLKNLQKEDPDAQVMSTIGPGGVLTDAQPKRMFQGSDGQVYGAVPYQKASRLEGDVDAARVGNKLNFAQAGLLASAGGAHILATGAAATTGVGIGHIAAGAVGLAAPFLAGAAMVIPAAAGLYSQYHQLQNLAAQKAELMALPKDQLTSPVRMGIKDTSGNHVEDQTVEVPIADQLKAIGTQQKVCTIVMTALGTSIGAISAVALGAPIMMMTAALAIPATVAVAMFPKETFDLIKSVPGKVLAAASNLASQAGDGVSRMFSSKSKEEYQAAKLEKAIASSVSDPKIQEFLAGPDVQAEIQRTGLTQDDAARLSGSFVRSILTKDPTELNALETNAQGGDPAAQKQLDLATTIGQGLAPLLSTLKQ